MIKHTRFLYRYFAYLPARNRSVEHHPDQDIVTVEGRTRNEESPLAVMLDLSSVSLIIPQDRPLAHQTSDKP